MSIFESMTMMPADPILGLSVAFKKDPREHKVNLGVGAYTDSEGAPYVLETVKKAERLTIDRNLFKEYGPIEGDPVFIEKTVELIFGADSRRIPDVCCLQTLGATGALRIGAAILALKPGRTAYVPDPTWPNHFSIFERSGFQTETYPYYDSSAHALRFADMCEQIKAMRPGSVMILQGPCHNPTGCDPTKEQWIELSKLLKRGGVIPFFDLSYLGFGEGLEEDAFAVRQFAGDGHEMLVAFSYSKNMGLYGERIGALAILADSPERAKIVMSHAKQLVRSQYSMAPLHAGRIVATILSDNGLRKEWIAELSNIRTRIHGMRAAFAAGLMAKNSGMDLSFLEKQKGIFSFCGIDRDRAVRLRDEFGIFVPMNGRVNVAGLTMHTIDYVISSVATVLKS